MEPMLFAIFKEGHKEEMAVVCIDHVSAYIEADHAGRGPASSYILRLVDKGPCVVCVSR